MLSEENERKINELRQRRDEFRKNSDVFTSEEFYAYVREKAFSKPNYTPEMLKSFGIAEENIPTFLDKEKENNARTFKYFFDQVNQKAPYSTDLTRRMHEELMDGLIYGAGSYRSARAMLASTAIIPPNYVKIPFIMAQLEADVNTLEKRTLDTALHIHYTILTTQPFSDANKRTARLMMNLYLMERGYPPIFVEKEDKREYLSSMEEKFVKSDENRYYSFMLDLLKHSFDDVSQMSNVKIKHKDNLPLVIVNSNQHVKN